MAFCRGRLITEEVIRLALAEAIQSQAKDKLTPEYNYPAIPGSSSLGARRTLSQGGGSSISSQRL